MSNDPVILQARTILADAYHKTGFTAMGDLAAGGEMDEWAEMNAVVLALKAAPVGMYLTQRPNRSALRGRLYPGSDTHTVVTFMDVTGGSHTSKALARRFPDIHARHKITTILRNAKRTGRVRRDVVPCTEGGTITLWTTTLRVGH